MAGEVFEDGLGPGFVRNDTDSSLEVVPSEEGSGWFIVVKDSWGRATSSLPQNEAVLLAKMLLGGPDGTGTAFSKEF